MTQANVASPDGSVLEREIVLVEDDDDHGNLVKRFSRGLGKLKWFRNGPDAVNHLFYSGPETKLPSVILLDLNLPGIKGQDILKKLKTTEEGREKGLHKVPVVILTSSNRTEDISAAYASYVNSYLLKPGTLEDWQSLIGEIDRYWLNMNVQG